MIRFKPIKEEKEAYLLPIGEKKWYSIEDLEDTIDHLMDVKSILEEWQYEEDNVEE